MLNVIHSLLDPSLVHEWQVNGHLSLKSLDRLVEMCGDKGGGRITLEKLNPLFNGSIFSRETLKLACSHGKPDAGLLLDMLALSSEGGCPHEVLEDGLFHHLISRYWEDEAGFVSSGHAWYPLDLQDRKVGICTEWIGRVLSEATGRFQDFSSGRSSDTAVLVGNGTSLKNEDFSLLEGQDVFISNYAIKHPWLARIARGIAVSNPWVASQEPFWFNLASCWKFFPFWHADSIQYDKNCVFLNAYGGNLFFSKNVTEHIAWHSTVTYFWLQILYSAGYRKVVLIGMDNFYQQPPGLKEGDFIHQKAEDLNHFDPSYFKGKRWQAADTRKMEETYAMAKDFYERDGREIVNCTVNGKLELFRRSELAREISRGAQFVRRTPATSQGPDEKESPSVVVMKRQLCLVHPSPGNASEFNVEGRLAGRELVAILGLRAERAMKVEIRLTGGNFASNGSIRRFTLHGSGTEWIALKHIFSEDHKVLRIDITSANETGNQPELPTVDHMLVLESTSSVFNHLSSNDGLLALAQLLERDHCFLGCIPLYLYLATIRPLEIYEAAARSALGLCGVGAREDQENVFRHLGYEPNPIKPAHKVVSGIHRPTQP